MSEQRPTRPDHLRLLQGSNGDSPEADDGDQSEDARHTSDGRPADPIRVLIAEGQGLIRAGYRALLESDEDIEVVGDAASGHQAIALAADTRPDVVLLDAGLPGLDALETIAAIVSQAVDAAVMLIVPRETDEAVFRALEAGAAGVLRKDAESDELIRAVQVLAKGDALISAVAMRRLLRHNPAKRAQARARPELLEELTEREREVMALAGAGLSNGEIAERLVISPKTAKTHVSRAMVKLGARHRAQLVVLAYETGLVLTRQNRGGRLEAFPGGDQSGPDDPEPLDGDLLL